MNMVRNQRWRRTPDKAWQSLASRFMPPVPANVRPWIRLQTSMTKQLKSRFGPGVAVRVLHNGMGRLHDDEQDLFFPRRARGFVREVVLHANGLELMVARTVFTSQSLCSDKKVMELGNKPLGELLFAKGNAEWLVREYTQVNSSVPAFSLVQRVVGHPAPRCWARRSLFLLDQQPLLVTEIFLPAMLVETENTTRALC